MPKIDCRESWQVWPAVVKLDKYWKLVFTAKAFLGFGKLVLWKTVSFQKPGRPENSVFKTHGHSNVNLADLQMSEC